MIISRNNIYNNQIIFIDGPIKSGKSFISRMLECFDGVEKSREDEIFYFICKLNKYDKLDDDTSIALIKAFSDRYLYNQLIGRELNHRLADETSIFKTKNPSEYIKRISIQDGEVVREKIIKESPIFQNMITHNLNSFGLLFKAFGYRMKYIYVMRNPIDLIYNQWKSHKGGMIGINPLDIQLSYDSDGITYPIFITDNHHKLYRDANTLEKIIMELYVNLKNDMAFYFDKPLEKKKQIKFIIFEEFEANPNTFIESLEEFIERKHTIDYYWMSEKGKRKEPFDYDNLLKKEKEIKSKIRDDYRMMFVKLMDMYQGLINESRN